ncbi:hypothetical protein COD03_27015 [Bacillus cereus]|nr:hypothetical protein COD03_27015 [Bacillus cereus]
MGMSTILVLGGSNGRTLEKLAKKRDCQVIFHDGKNHGGVKKTFRFEGCMRFDTYLWNYNC